MLYTLKFEFQIFTRNQQLIIDSWHFSMMGMLDDIYIILDGSEWDTRNIPRVRANIARIEDECNIGPIK